MFSEYLFRKIDNSPLVLFRIFFGIMVMAECWGAILTGWVTNNLVIPNLTFTFIGFEWLNYFLGPNMYYYFGVMGFFGFLISFGFIYKFASFMFALMWTLVYFMQKTSYNNHYYLFMIIAWAMAIMPAHRFFSIDSLLFNKTKKLTCRNWVRVFFISQMFIFYVFAAIAKLYPDWFNGVYLSQKFFYTAQYIENNFKLDGLAGIVRSVIFAKIIAYLGFFFDLLIVPLMLWGRTRSFGLKCAIIFHLFNSVVFQIGIFPYFSLGMMIFFYNPTLIQNLFFKSKTFLLDRVDEDNLITSKRILFSYVFVLYFIWQIYLPIRHYFIPGNVFWTEEGHRLSWRMMLRNRSNSTVVTVAVPNKEGKYKTLEEVNLSQYLTWDQLGRFGNSADMIWQFAQFIKEDYRKKGINNVKVFVDTKISVNGSPYYQYTNPKVDIANLKWSYFGHQPWLKNQPKELQLTYFY